MPAESRAQYRFMQGVKHGTIHAKGLSRAQAAEWVAATPDPYSLPERKKKRRSPYDYHGRSR